MSFIDRAVPTPEQRRERNREEMTTAILDAARDIMREGGAGALNLNQLARRVNVTTPALYSYFPSKFAIYDALYQLGIQMVREQEEEIWRQTRPDWDRLRRWFDARVRFVIEHPELYRLMFHNPVPGFTPSDDAASEARKQLENARRGLKEVIAAGVIQPDIPVDRAVDLLLAIRHGIVAERIGKANVVPADSGRFEHLVEDAVAMLSLAWKPGIERQDGRDDAPG